MKQVSYATFVQKICTEVDAEDLQTNATLYSFYNPWDQILDTNSLKEEGFIWVPVFTSLVAWPCVSGESIMEMGLCGGRRHSTHEGQETEWGE